MIQGVMIAFTFKSLLVASMRIYANLSSISFGVTLGVWHFGRLLLRELGASKEFRIVGLLPEPAALPLDARPIFDEIHDLASCREARDGVELLLHHFQAPGTSCPYAVIAHDLHLYDVPWKYGNPARQQSELQRLIGVAAAVLTHFPRTYYDLPKVLPKVPNALFLTVSPSMREPVYASPVAHAAIAEKYKLQPGIPLILYPAQLQLHKNHLTLFKAVKRILHRNPELRVVCCGSDSSEGITHMLREALYELELIDTVYLPGRVSDDELQALYERADLVVSPSLAEGGAYIAQEAIEQGKKVAIAAIRPALLHMQLMNAHIPTFDPLDIDCMASTIMAALAESQNNTAALSTIKSWTWALAASRYALVLRWVQAGRPSGQIPPFATAETGVSIADRAVS